ncbi:hypothetical protein L1049_026196 [Liquidambar formosana]|uniref:BSD domain-containing protein n=1 Tax=Liquidambar formosana TaxID=63359 RepID=A0AAP0R734_LIQFO
MSWLARSLANSLRLDDDELEDDDDHPHSPTSKPHTPPPAIHDDDEHHDQNHEDPSRGVKEDLSELKQTLTRQLWGVASFLAPPPSSSHPSTPSHSQIARSVYDWNRGEQQEPSDQSVSGDVSDEDAVDLVETSGIRGDFDDFRSRAVLGFSKIASNFLTVGSEEGKESLEECEVGNAIGVTEEVLAFARNISMHPETWLDFPQYEEEDMDDFDMSDAQLEHALAVEHLAPRLAALRIELCPSHMSEGYFWKVYFVLLHSRLNKHDADLLSTPQVMIAKSLWMQELQKQTKQKQDWPGRSTFYSNESKNSQQEDLIPDSFCYAHTENTPHRTFAFDSASFSVTSDVETDKHPVESSDMKIIDKSVIEEKLVIKTEDKDDDDGDDWPEEENFELGGFGGTTILVGNEEDVSFSDLEDDDDSYVPIKSKSTLKGN